MPRESKVVVRSECAIGGIDEARRCCARPPSASYPSRYREACRAWRVRCGCRGLAERRDVAANRSHDRLARIGVVQRPTRFTRQMRDRLDQRQQLRDVVAVGLGQDGAQRNALRVDAEVVLAARLAAIGWVRSSFFPPCTARTEQLSTTTRDKSILSAPRSLDNSTR